MKTLAIILLLSVAASAQTIDSVRPDCAGPGGRVLLSGDGFGDAPTVLIAGVRARVLRNTDSRILALIPEDAAPGAAKIEVGDASGSIDIVAAGAPVVRRLSSHMATPGQILVLVGRHLANATAVFIDGDRNEVARAPLRGRGRVAFLRVPRDLATGKYTLLIVNDAGNSGACSPIIKVVEAGPPTLDALSPEGQKPGRALTATGSDLGPIGLCVAHWLGGDGSHLAAGGISNGYDTVYTYVPAGATPGATYKVHLEFRDGSSTEDAGLVGYTVGAEGGPEILGLQYNEGPAGSPVGILGEGFFRTRAIENRALAVADTLPLVEFTRNGVAHKARIVFGIPGRGDEPDFLVVRVPEVADGDYRVTVTVGGATSNSAGFTVKTMMLTVTSMKPDRQSTTGYVFPVLFTGTGFGSGRDADDIAVTWERSPSDSVRPRTGRILFRNDREMFVVPPGGSSDTRLVAGEYTVRVTRYPGTDREVSVVAGIYIVE